MCLEHRKKYYTTDIRFLKDTQKLVKSLRKNEVDIYLHVYNQKNNVIDGLIGFSSSSEEKISLHGFMNTQLNNIIGKGESIILNWKGNQNVSQNP